MAKGGKGHASTLVEVHARGTNLQRCSTVHALAADFELMTNGRCRSDESHCHQVAGVDGHDEAITPGQLTY